MTTATILAEGLHFGEGPRWHEGKLWFSDFYDHTIKTVDEAGIVTTVLRVNGQSSGLGWLPDGRLLYVSMLDRKLMRLEPDGIPVVHADLSGIATWHCNDMVVDAVGRAYVGNFGFNLEEAMAAGGPAAVLAEHPLADMARVDPDGSVQVAATGLHFPNGAVITPDGRTMILAETLAARLTAFDIAEDGSLSNQRVWAGLGTRVPDGICLDEAGRVWAANALGPEVVCVAEGGVVVAVVGTSQPCFACMLGGADGRTLFCLTAAGSGEDVAAATRTGRIEVARVESPRAGRP